MHRARVIAFSLALSACAQREATAQGASPSGPERPRSATTVSRALSDPRAEHSPVAREARTLTVALSHAPHEAHPEVLVHTPAGFDLRAPLHLVLFFHGWRGCVSVVAGDEDAPCRRGGGTRRAIGVLDAFDRAGVNAVLLLPQLAFDRRSSDGGRLNDPGGLARMIDELRARPDVRALIGDPTRAIARVTFAGHSGAHAPMARLLALDEVRPQCVLFFDALYRIPEGLEHWSRLAAARFEPARATSEGPTRLAVPFTTHEGTGGTSVRFLRSIAARLSPETRAAAVTLADDRALHARGAPLVWTSPLLGLRTHGLHENVPRETMPALLRDCTPPALRAAR